jgi:hypothetical protein
MKVYELSIGTYFWGFYIDDTEKELFIFHKTGFDSICILDYWEGKIPDHKIQFVEEIKKPKN